MINCPHQLLGLGSSWVLTHNLVKQARDWGQITETHLWNLVTLPLMHSPAHTSYILQLNDVTWQSRWLETSLFLNTSVDLCSRSLLLRWKHNAICHLLQLLRLYESTPSLPHVICLTGQGSSDAQSHKGQDALWFVSDGWWLNDNRCWQKTIHLVPTSIWNTKLFGIWSLSCYHTVCIIYEWSLPDYCHLFLMQRHKANHCKGLI